LRSSLDVVEKRVDIEGGNVWIAADIESRIEQPGLSQQVVCLKEIGHERFLPKNCPARFVYRIIFSAFFGLFTIKRLFVRRRESGAETRCVRGLLGRRASQGIMRGAASAEACRDIAQQARSSCLVAPMGAKESGPQL
jgi:hypothetical protein